MNAGIMTRVRCRLVSIAAGLLSVLVAHGSAASKPPEATSTPSPAASSHRALIDRYCVGCHNDRLKTGGLSLSAIDMVNVANGARTWEKVVRKLRVGLMPPAGAPRPDQGSADAFAGWLEGELDRAARSRPNPGRPETFHRLNRAEYR